MPTPTDDLVAVLRGQLSLTLDPHFGVAINELLRLQAENQALRAESARRLVAIEHAENWLPEDCAAACEARGIIEDAAAGFAAMKDHP